MEGFAKNILFLSALVICNTPIISISSASAATINVSKEGSFTITKGNNPVITGRATLGANFADDKRTQGFDLKNQSSIPFIVSETFTTLPTVSLTASDGGAQGNSKVSVGKATTSGNNITVPYNISAQVTIPDPPGRGRARAAAKVNLNGRQTLQSLTVNGIKITGPAFIRAWQAKLQHLGIVLDPIHFFAENLVTGEIIDEDIYANSFRAFNGGGVGFNEFDRLELNLMDDPILNSFAEFDSKTLVPFATDFTGTARLENGLLDVTGIFDPGSDPITDFWDLTFSTINPSFITKAVLKTSVFDFSVMEIFPEFLDPNTSDSDVVDISVSVDVQATLASSIPESSSILGILILGTLGTASTLKRKLKSSKSSLPTEI
ncbi:MAG: PEP-CTERM sorting domain-containing protein [Crocosphaera sp.]